MSTGSGAINVLHVDDEPGFSKLVAEFLEREDERMSVETVQRASEGLGRLQADGFDCVVSDYDMPEQNGIEFLESVRSDDPDLPFILYTGKGSEEVAETAISAGVTDYLQKETGTEQYEILANRIRNAVEGYRAHRAVEESERQLRQVYERITDGFFAVNSDWKYVYVNEEGARLTDSTVDELLGNTVWESFPELIGSPFEDALRTAMQTKETATIEDYYPAHSAWYDVRIYASEDGISIYFQDVTDRKERELELEAEQAFTEQALDTLTDLFYVVDPDGGLRRWNERVTEVTGYTDEELAEIDVLALFPEDERDTAAGAIEEVISTGETTIELDIETKDGARIPHEISGAKLSATDGELAGLVGIARDITEIRQLKDEYESVFRTAEDAIFLFDVEESDDDYTFRLRSLNPAHESITGLDSEADRGKTPIELLGEETGTTVASNFRRCVEAREPISYDELLEMPRGEVEWQTNLSPVIRDGTVTQIVGVSRDVTDRKERERKITALHDVASTLESCETTDAVYRLLVDAAEAVLNYDQAIADTERGGYLIPKATSSDIESDEYYDRTPVDAEDSLAATAYRTGEPSRVDDLRTHDVTPKEVSYRAVLSIPIGDYGLLQAVSDEPAKFDEIDQELAELLCGHARNALDRIEHERDLRRQNERLDEFASVVSHDLRNPLNVAQGHLELAQTDCESEYLEPVASAHERMSELISDLRTLARTGEALGELESVDIPTVVSQCWQTVGYGDAELEIETEQTIRADRSRLRQVFENLFRNAVEHGDQEVTITVGDLPNGFYVEDDGSGIPPERRDEIFETGYSTTEEGTGFGLSIVQQVSTAHGWTVEVTEGTDGGARFEFSDVHVE